MVLFPAHTVDREQHSGCLINDQFDSTGDDEITLEIRDLPGRDTRARSDQLQQLLASEEAQIAPHRTLAGVAAGVFERSPVGLVSDRNQDQVGFLP